MRTGLLRDDDGDPTSHNRNFAEMKKKPKHKAHMGGKRRGHKPRMGYSDNKSGVG